MQELPVELEPAKLLQALPHSNIYLLADYCLLKVMTFRNAHLSRIVPAKLPLMECLLYGRTGESVLLYGFTRCCHITVDSGCSCSPYYLHLLVTNTVASTSCRMGRAPNGQHKVVGAKT